MTTRIGSQCAEQGQTYCEDVDQYPAKLIATLMGDEEVQKLLNESVMENSLKMSSRFRYGHGYGFEDLRRCKTRTETIYPRVAIASDNRWKLIINVAPHRQGIRVELCDGVNQCPISSILPNGYRAQCKQMFDEQRLLSVEEEDGREVIRKEYFRMPSHCECIENVRSAFD